MAAAVLDGINVASLALTAMVTWQLMRTAVIDWITLPIALLSVFLLLRFRALNSAWLILAAGILGVGKTVIRL